MLEPSPSAKTPWAASERRWLLEDVDFGRADRATIADDWLGFRIVATASFIEAASDLYARNLGELFAGDSEIVPWLARSWEPEELQHGAALRAYVEKIWPSFAWEDRFRAFLTEYSRSCTVPDLEPERALELAARCIVEMGTSTLYRALRGYAREPILRQIATLIYADEVRHYKHFYRFFRRYHRREQQSRLRLSQTLIRRLLATHREDGFCAYRYVWDFGPTGRRFDENYRSFEREVTMLIRRYTPREMPAHMILKPLALPSPVVDAATRLSDSLFTLWLSAEHFGIGGAARD